jgi:hypothetical protein
VIKTLFSTVCAPPCFRILSDDGEISQAAEFQRQTGGMTEFFGECTSNGKLLCMFLLRDGDNRPDKWHVNWPFGEALKNIIFSSVYSCQPFLAVSLTNSDLTRLRWE